MSNPSPHLQSPPRSGHPIDGRAERILAAGFAEFSRRGFAATPLSQVARRAGVATATVKLYFPSKEDLFREVVRSSIVTGLEAAVPPMDATGPGDRAAGRLRDFARRFWRSMDEPENAALLRLSIGELPAFPELALFHATEVIERAAAELERILRDGARTGELRLDDARGASRVFLSALITHALWFAFPTIYAGITGRDRARAEAAVVDLLLGGLGAEPG